MGWISNGILSSLCVFLITIYALSQSAFRKDGNMADITHIGSTMYTCLIWTVNCQIALIMSHFTWISHFLIWGSIFCWYIFLYLYGTLPPEYTSGGGGFRMLTEAIGPAPLYWILTLLVVLVSLLPYFIHTVVQRSFYPMDDQLIQEISHYCGKHHIIENPMWVREQENSQKKTQVGFTARVEAKIRSIKGHLQQKKKLLPK